MGAEEDKGYDGGFRTDCENVEIDVSRTMISCSPPIPGFFDRGSLEEVAETLMAHVVLLLDSGRSSQSYWLQIEENVH